MSEELKKTELPITNVEFDELTHTYRNVYGQFFMGVTELMKKHGLSADYSGIPESVLANAAEYGSQCHKLIENYDNGLTVEQTTELKAYKKLGLKVHTSEYLVTDNKIVASMIDKVLDDYSLVDLKFTSVLHERSVSWQLSIYAYLFENQTGLKVPNIYVAHYDKAKKKFNLKEIERKPDASVAELLQCEEIGVTYVDDTNEELTLPQVFSPDEIVMLKDLESSLEQVEITKKALESQIQDFRDRLYNAMLEKKVKKIETENMTYTLVAPTTSERFDSKKFKTDHPELAEKYIKQSERKGYLKVTIK